MSSSSSDSTFKTLTRPDGAVIRYRVLGRGRQPVLLLANGGMRSKAAMWANSPWNPLQRLNTDDHTLIAMDQRYSHDSDTVPDTHSDVGWTTFRDDQLALLDHWHISQKCHIVGSCIGPSYGLQLLRDAPDRFDRAVLLQSIGLARHTTEPIPWNATNAGCEAEHWFGAWARDVIKTGRAALPTVLDRMHQNMFGEHREFVFSITRDEMKQIPHPLLVFCGRDIFHPAETAREICRLSRHATLVEDWRDVGPEKLEQAHQLIQTFLQESV